MEFYSVWWCCLPESIVVNWLIICKHISCCQCHILVGTGLIWREMAFCTSWDTHAMLFKISTQRVHFQSLLKVCKQVCNHCPSLKGHGPFISAFMIICHYYKHCQKLIFQKSVLNMEKWSPSNILNFYLE